MRPSNVISSRCIGYQVENGDIKTSVWSGIILFDDGHSDVRYWTETGGVQRCQDHSPRVDRPMPERPSGEWQ
jgi:hypothetical protein